MCYEEDVEVAKEMIRVILRVICLISESLLLLLCQCISSVVDIINVNIVNDENVLHDTSKNKNPNDNQIFVVVTPNHSEKDIY